MTRLDVTEGLDFEWREDVLYREPPAPGLSDVALWCVEAVSLDDLDMVVRVESFERREEAEAFLGRAEDDLHEMTKHQFEESYLSHPADETDSAEE